MTFAFYSWVMIGFPPIGAVALFLHTKCIILNIMFVHSAPLEAGKGLPSRHTNNVEFHARSINELSFA